MNILDKNILVLTGAGISKESGISTFREKNGLWENYKIEDVCTVEAFEKNPDLVNDFYNQRRRDITEKNIKPNEAHHALAKLEQKCRKDFLLVTQNVDKLHEEAGSKQIKHMHGTLYEAYCMYCKNIIKLDFELSTKYECKYCHNSGKVRVDVVWFGEQPKFLDMIYKYFERVEVFISIGTSNNVYPAAGFIDLIQQLVNDVELYEFNLETTHKSSLFTKVYKGPATKTLPKFVESLI